MSLGARSNAFSDAVTQAAVLQEWRKRTAKHEETVSSLRRKVNRLKGDAEVGRRGATWLLERDDLNREQDACEYALDTLREGLGNLVEDLDTKQRALELSAFKVLLSRRLSEVGARYRSGSCSFSSAADKKGLQERVRHLRQWIAEEAMRSSTEINALSAPSPSGDGAPSTVAECHSIGQHSRRSFAVLCNKYLPEAQLRGTFATALESAEEDAVARLRDVALQAPLSTPADALRTVGLIVKMGQRARQFDLSASTAAALAERTSTVLPHLSPSQIRTAIEESTELRRVRVLSQAILTDYQSTTAALLSSCESAFLLAAQAAAERLERAEAARQRASERKSRHARLAEERASYDTEQRRRQSEEAQLLEALAAKERAALAKRTEEFQERLRLFEAYVVQQRELRQKEQELTEIRTRAEQEEKAARMQHNEMRVESRRKRDEQRQKEWKKREEEVMARRARKQQALERFFAAVDKQLGVEADPQRILKATTSSAQTERFEALAEITRPSLTGFSDEQIMKDPRVRLYHALLAAGLHTTAYGREVATRGYRIAPAQQSSEGNPLRGDFS